MANPLLVSRLEAARLLSVSARSVDRFVDEGMPVARRGKAGRAAAYDVRACFAWYLEREKASLVGEDVSPQKARALLDLRRREELELKLQVRRGELMPIAEVARDFADFAVSVKARLRRIPDAVADRVVAAEGPHAVKALLLTEIDAALEELAAKADALAADDPAA